MDPGAGALLIYSGALNKNGHRFCRSVDVDQLPRVVPETGKIFRTERALEGKWLRNKRGGSARSRSINIHLVQTRRVKFRGDVQSTQPRQVVSCKLVHPGLVGKKDPGRQMAGFTNVEHADDCPQELFPPSRIAPPLESLCYKSLELQRKKKDRRNRTPISCPPTTPSRQAPHPAVLAGGSRVADA